MDGGSPPLVRDAIARLSREKGFRLIRTEEYLVPNRARNLGARDVDTEHVVFIDNDVIPEPGWLDALVRCADETGAWIVGPVYCIGDPRRKIVHVAMGEARIEEAAGRRAFRERHCFVNQHLDAVLPKLRRAPCEMVEFHCLLVRRDALARLGPLDEGLMSALEHVDLCLAAREAGGAVYTEPSSVVTYVAPPPFRDGDLRYFLLRWSDEWNRQSVARFAEKWRLPPDDAGLRSVSRWLGYHRKLAVPRPLRILAKALGRRVGDEAHRRARPPDQRAVRLRVEEEGGRGGRYFGGASTGGSSSFSFGCSLSFGSFSGVGCSCFSGSLSTPELRVRAAC